MGTYNAILFDYLPTDQKCNSSGSGENVRAYLLHVRQNYSRNYSSIRSGPLAYKEKIALLGTISQQE